MAPTHASGTSKPTIVAAERPHLAPDEDATIVVRPPSARRWRVAAALALALVLSAGGGVAVWLLRPPPPAVIVPAPVPAPRITPAPAPAPFAIATADEATIDANVSERLAIFRFAPAPAVVVLDFASLEQQGQMLNRVAALIEKAGLPRERVLSDAELDTAIRASGDTPATYYYGHDYSAAELVRFFALADRDHVALTAEETRLRALLRQLGWFAPDTVGALISIPRVGADANVTPPARATILHHELSHGSFFSDAAYAQYVRAFWRTALTGQERADVRKFLGQQGYDTTDEDLMLNEMQAYVMFTYDPRFCKALNVGMTLGRRLALIAEFRDRLPDGWAKQALTHMTEAPQ